MRCQHGGLVRTIILFQATDRTVAAPILGRSHAVALVAVVRPLIAAATINTGQFGCQPADHFWKRELAARTIAVACVTDRRRMSVAQEAAVP